MSKEQNIQMLLNELRNFEAKTGKKYRLIALQAPEGLKTSIAEIAGFLEKEGYDVVLMADPCWGACDLRIREAELIGAELIIHIGHKKFAKNIESEIPILYFLWKYNIEYDENNILKELMKIKENSVGLIYSVQFEDLAQKIAHMLDKLGKKAEIGGYVLGCWTENSQKLKTDALLYIGSGNFHALGAKCRYALDMEKMELRDVSKDAMTMEKRRWALIEKARNADTIGIIVSSKPGQFDYNSAEKLKKRLEEKNKKAFILIMDEVTDLKLMGIKLDAFINTACVRIRDDYFQKPVINIEDVQHLF